MNLYIIENAIFDRIDLFTIAANNITEVTNIIKTYMTNMGYLGYSINLTEDKISCKSYKGILNITEPKVINYKCFHYKE